MDKNTELTIVTGVLFLAIILARLLVYLIKSRMFNGNGKPAASQECAMHPGQMAQIKMLEDRAKSNEERLINLDIKIEKLINLCTTVCHRNREKE